MKTNSENREHGYYWITPITMPTPMRQVAYWNGKSWWIVGIDRPLKESDVENVNEKQVIEDEKSRS